MSAFEVILHPNCPKEPVDDRSRDVRLLLEKTLETFNCRFGRAGQLRIGVDGAYFDG